MTSSAPDPKIIARVVNRLTSADITPVLIGGMALAVYGSTRATRDCDFAAAKTDGTLRRSVHAMIDEGFSVIFGWDSANYQPTKIDSDKSTCGSWAVIDRPESIWFWHPGENIRVDLVFDLPIPIEDIMARATWLRLEDSRFLIAAPEDLEQMKVTSFAARPSRIADKQDLDFLRSLIEQDTDSPKS